MLEPPEWLETGRVEDAAFESAYDAVSPICKAAIKTALAITYKFYPTPFSGEIGSRHYSRGFRDISRSEPAETAVIIFPAEFRAAARICAAAAAPAFAGVKRVFALALGGSPADEILTTLELCGVEDVFRVSSSGLRRFVEEISASSKTRAIFLGGVAAPAGKFFYEEKREPTLTLADPEEFNPDTLLFALGSIPPRDPREFADAVYLSKKRAESGEYPASLRLTPGFECYWRFEDMPRDFFRSRSLTLILDEE